MTAPAWRRGKRPELELLPPHGQLDVDLAAEAAVPFILELLELERAARPSLRLIDKDRDANTAPLRPVPSLVEGS